MKRRWHFRGIHGDDVVFVALSDFAGDGAGALASAEALRRLDEVLDGTLDRDGTERAAAVEMLEAAGRSRLDLAAVSRERLRELLRAAVRERAIGLVRVARPLRASAGSAAPEPAPPPAPSPAKPQPKSEKTWITIKVMYEDGDEPYSGAFQVKLPDGRVEKGKLGSSGVKEISGIDPGSCEVSFPDLDANAWQPA